MRRGLGITFRITLAFLLLVGTLSVGTSLAAYVTGRQALENAVESELLSTAIEKEAALEAWATDTQTQVASVAATADIRDALAALASALSTRDAAGRQANHDRLVASLKVWIGPDHPFQELLILDSQTGQVWAATAPSDEGKFMENWLFFAEGQKGAFVQNPLYAVSAQAPVMFASAPIHDQAGRLSGVLAGQLNLDKLDAILQRSSGMRQTRDAFLVNTSNLFVTQPRFVPDPAVLQRGIHTEAVDRCLQGNSSQIISQDYRGVPAIITYRWLAARSLCLIVKVNQAEALAQAQAFGQTILLIGALAVLIASALAIGLARSITRPILALHTGAVRLGQGDLGYQVEVNAADELGQLTEAFNGMAANLRAKAQENTQLFEALRQSHSELEKRVEERTAALRETNAYLENLFNYANAPIIVWDPQFRITRFNRAFEALTGRTAAETLGKPLDLLFPPDQVERSRELIGRTLTGERWETVEISIQHRDGSIHILLWNSATIFSADGQTPMATIAQGQDITGRQRAEAELQTALLNLKRSNQELEQFAYVASHDLQEPLRMVASYTQLLAQRYAGQLDDKAHKYIAYAVDGALRMQRLINDLLTYSRVNSRSRPPELVDFGAVLGEALRNLAAALQESRAVVTHGDLPTVRADATQLLQLFQNLIANGIKFRGADPPQVHVSASDLGPEWRFSVQDNGIGVDPKYADRLFVIFQRLHTREEYPGTGIGLAICKRIVERHGGRIWFELAAGQGSIFYFTLPK